MSKADLRKRVLARLKFNPGIPALRLAIACGVDPTRVSPRRAKSERIPPSFRLLLQQMVEDGEIQAWHPATHEEAVYYPADWEPPAKQLFIKPKTELTTMTQAPAFETYETPKRNFDQTSEALWDALDVFRKRGQPFTINQLLNFAEVSHPCLKKRTEVQEAIEELIEKLGRSAAPRKQAAKATKSTKTAAKKSVKQPTQIIKEEPTMTPLANTTLEQKQAEVQQRINGDKEFAQNLAHKVGELMRGAGRLDEEIEELIQRLAEARADRERYQKLLDGALALQEYVSPCLEESEEIQPEADAA